MDIPFFFNLCVFMACRSYGKHMIYSIVQLELKESFQVLQFRNWFLQNCSVKMMCRYSVI